MMGWLDARPLASVGAVSTWSVEPIQAQVRGPANPIPEIDPPVGVPPVLLRGDVQHQPDGQHARRIIRQDAFETRRLPQHELTQSIELPVSG